MIRAILAGLMLLAGCQMAPPPAPGVGVCAFAAAPTVLEQSGDPHGPNGRLLQVWDVADDPVLWSETAPEGAYADFRDKLAKTGSDTDPLALLRASPTTNNQLVIANANAWVKPAGCLEKLLVGVQHERMDTFAAPTEFAGLVLRSADGKRLRVYFYTINQDGIGRMTPITAAAEADQKAGWRTLIGMHVHAFHPGKPDLNGITAPSVPDAGFNFNYAAGSGMEQAWITNGVSTVRIPAKAFGMFERE